MQRASHRSPPIFSDRPFAGQGVSVYLGTSLPLITRPQRMVHGSPLAVGDHPYSAESIARTTRVGSESGDSGELVEVEVDASAYASQTLWIDVRHFKDRVENSDPHPQQLLLDGSGDPVSEILGEAISLGYVALAGGIIEVSFRWIPSAYGLTVETFELRRVSGPTSPAAVSITANSSALYQIESEALDDSATYSLEVVAISGSTERVLFTLASVQADASGPPIPSPITTEVV
ncbi:hypothetical protein KOR42_39260 [Thalassoglobus neptunius]|uniref:Fibronectin type-III domain-containing protein n=1 Tax=Thalassoglobus neptunius TaxID=1938619 RepID=A0A5C5WEG5_9PLAN|nr:hypothetical protein [Thalassoglobus neptunius]TWT49010.1 hypothetical protein KOR42_39260 [Thalassoglobus neptunius]